MTQYLTDYYMTRLPILNAMAGSVVYCKLAESTTIKVDNFKTKKKDTKIIRQISINPIKGEWDLFVRSLCSIFNIGHIDFNTFSEGIVFGTKSVTAKGTCLIAIMAFCTDNCEYSDDAAEAEKDGPGGYYARSSNWSPSKRVADKPQTSSFALFGTTESQ